MTAQQEQDVSLFAKLPGLIKPYAPREEVDWEKKSLAYDPKTLLFSDPVVREEFRVFMNRDFLPLVPTLFLILSVVFFAGDFVYIRPWWPWKIPLLLAVVPLMTTAVIDLRAYFLLDVSNSGGKETNDSQISNGKEAENNNKGVLTQGKPLTSTSQDPYLKIDSPVEEQRDMEESGVDVDDGAEASNNKRQDDDGVPSRLPHREGLARWRYWCTYSTVVWGVFVTNFCVPYTFDENCVEATIQSPGFTGLIEASNTTIGAGSSTSFTSTAAILSSYCSRIILPTAVLAIMTYPVLGQSWSPVHHFAIGPCAIVLMLLGYIFHPSRGSAPWQDHLVRWIFFVSIITFAFVVHLIRYRQSIQLFRQEIKVFVACRLAAKREEEASTLLCNILPFSALSRLARQGGDVDEEEGGSAPGNWDSPTALAVSSFQGDDREDGVYDIVETATVLFSDMKGFTAWSSTRTAREVVGMLNALCFEIDLSAVKHGVEKIKTIGDAYWAVAGLPEACTNHAEKICSFGNSMLTIVTRQNKRHPEWGTVAIRIGVHSGPLAGGIFGKKQLSYEVFGETSTLANQIEAKGVPGRVVVSEVTMQQLGYELDNSSAALDHVPLGRDDFPETLKFLSVTSDDKYSAHGPASTHGSTSSLRIYPISRTNTFSQQRNKNSHHRSQQGLLVHHSSSLSSPSAAIHHHPSSSTPNSGGGTAAGSSVTTQMTMVVTVGDDVSGGAADGVNGAESPASLRRMSLSGSFSASLSAMSSSQQREQRINLQEEVELRRARFKQLLAKDVGDRRRRSRAAVAEEHDEQEEGDDDEETVSAETATLEDIRVRYSKRKFPYLIQQFANDEVEEAFHRGLEVTQKSLRVLLRAVALAISIFVVVSVFITVGAQNSQIFFTNGASVLIACGGSLQIVDLVLSVFFPSGIPRGQAILQLVAMTCVIAGSSLLEPGASVLANDVTALTVFSTPIIYWANLGYVDAIFLMVGVCGILLPVAIWGIWLVGSFAAHLGLFFVVMPFFALSLFVLERKVRFEFLQQYVGDFYRRRQVEKSKELEALLSLMVPAHIVQELKIWMQTGMDPKSTIVHTIPSAAVCFIQLNPRHALAVGGKRNPFIEEQPTPLSLPTVPSVAQNSEPLRASTTPPPGVAFFAPNDDGLAPPGQVPDGAMLEVIPQPASAASTLQHGGADQHSRQENGSSEGALLQTLIHLHSKVDRIIEQEANRWIGKKKRRNKKKRRAGQGEQQQAFFPVVKIKTIGDVVLLAGPFGLDDQEDDITGAEEPDFDVSRSPGQRGGAEMETSLSPMMSGASFAVEDTSTPSQEGLPSPKHGVVAFLTPTEKACLTLARICLKVQEEVCPSRAGLHVGELVGAVLGNSRLCFDVFGDTVNTASRVMASKKISERSVGGTEEFKQHLVLAVTNSNSGMSGGTAVGGPVVSVSQEGEVITAKGKGEISVYQVFSSSIP